MSPNARKGNSYLAGALALLFGATVVASAAEGPAHQAQARATSGGSKILVAPGRPDTYGTSSSIVLTIPAWQFQSFDGSVQSGFGASAYARWSPTGEEVEAPVMLPAGALISSIELEGCDTSATDETVFILYYVDSSGTFTIVGGTGTTGAAETGGCGFYSLAIAPYTVDNFNNTYYIAVKGGSTAATNYVAMRVYYNLQVSPAPGSPTFSDVLISDSAFAFVEAFVSAGITVGCDVGPPARYCPDDFVTRRQMAVFFAKALGLHWPL